MTSATFCESSPSPVHRLLAGGGGGGGGYIYILTLSHTIIFGSHCKHVNSYFGT